jgi:hypothetical protein
MAAQAPTISMVGSCRELSHGERWLIRLRIDARENVSWRPGRKKVNASLVAAYLAPLTAKIPACHTAAVAVPVLIQAAESVQIGTGGVFNVAGRDININHHIHYHLPFHTGSYTDNVPDVRFLQEPRKHPPVASVAGCGTPDSDSNARESPSFFPSIASTLNRILLFIDSPAGTPNIFYRNFPDLRDLIHLTDFASKAYHACCTQNAVGALIRRFMDIGLSGSDQRLVTLHKEMLILHGECLLGKNSDPERIAFIRSTLAAETRTYAELLACVKLYVKVLLSGGKSVDSVDSIGRVTSFSLPKPSSRGRIFDSFSLSAQSF